MIHDAAVLVPPAPASALGATAAAALLAARGRSVLLLEPALEGERLAEPFLLPLPRSGQSGPDGLDEVLSLVALRTRLPPLDTLLERPPVPCQLVLPRHRLDLAADPATFAVELAREWPEAASTVASLDARLAELDAAVGAAPSRLLTGSPSRLGWIGDLVALLGRPRSWLRGSSALDAPLPDFPLPAAAAGVAAIGIGLGGLGRPPDRLADLWRPWAAARRGGCPGPGSPGLVARLRLQALASGAVSLPYDPGVLQVGEGTRGSGIAIRTAEGTEPLKARLLVSGWAAAALAPLAGGRLGTHLARLAATARPVRWAARLVVEVPAGILPVGLAPRALLAVGDAAQGGAPEPADPLLLESTPTADGLVLLALTALVRTPAADPGLALRLRRQLEWLIPFLPADAEGRITPPDPRRPVRFVANRTRPVALPPLAGRRIALVGPDVAPLLGPEGEALAALTVAGALAPRDGRGT